MGACSASGGRVRGFVFERVQFEGNEAGFRAPIGPRRMFFFFLFFFKTGNVKCEWESAPTCAF